MSGKKLLVSNPHTESTTLEAQVRHESTGTVLRPDTLGGTPDVHFKVNVDEGSGLSDLPMNTGRLKSIISKSEVNHEVTDLTEEVVLVDVPLAIAFAGVGIRVENSHTGEGGGSHEDGSVIGISDQLREVVHDNGGGNEVASGWEVNNGGLNGGRTAVVSASAAGGNGSVDTGRVVLDSVSSTAKVHNISVHLVVGGILVEGHVSVSNVGNPQIIGLEGFLKLNIQNIVAKF